MDKFSTPLVTVIIPTHNRPDFLKKTIQSIVQQTFSNMQIIVVSNGRNKENKKIADSFYDSRIEYYEQENSGGPASPRNNGIRNAKGKYIAFCDDDDIWFPEKIEKQYQALENNPEYSLCYTKMIRFDSNNEWCLEHESGKANFKTLLYENTVPISSIFVSKDLIQKLDGFLETSKVGPSEDYEFLLRYAQMTKFYFIDEYLIKYWSGNNRTTSVDSERTFKKSFNYLKSILNIYYIIYKCTDAKIYQFIMPTLNQIYKFLKVFLYTNIQKFQHKES